MVNKAIVVAMRSALPDGRLPESRHTGSPDAAALRARVRELETLCAEVYVAAVELGLPQPLLNRLWTVAAQGCSPHAFEIEMPPRLPMPQPVAAPVDSITKPTARQSEAVQMPDIRLMDRPRSPDSRPHPAQSELKALPQRRTVLVVDDDPMMLEVLVRILQRENYELLTAAGGPEALQLVDKHHAGSLDLLITDYAMPDMKGRELAEQMRTRYKDLRVLYQTGFSDMLFEDRVELEEGSAFLEKPFTARGLREAARFILFGSMNPAEPSQRASDEPGRPA